MNDETEPKAEPKATNQNMISESGADNLLGPWFTDRHGDTYQMYGESDPAAMINLDDEAISLDNNTFRQYQWTVFENDPIDLEKGYDPEDSPCCDTIDYLCRGNSPTIEDAKFRCAIILDHLGYRQPKTTP